MRVFIAVLVLIFSLQSWTKADDISDFEIEGMSVGDSLLDYYNSEEIKKNEKKAPHIVLNDNIIKKYNIKDISLSITHDGGFAIAVVIIL